MTVKLAFISLSILVIIFYLIILGWLRLTYKIKVPECYNASRYHQLLVNKIIGKWDLVLSGELFLIFISFNLIIKYCYGFWPIVLLIVLNGVGSGLVIRVMNHEVDKKAKLEEL